MNSTNPAGSPELQFRLLAENAKDVIWTVDMDLRFTYISPSAREISGYSIEEMQQALFLNMLTPESLEEVQQLIGRYLPGHADAIPDALSKSGLELSFRARNGHIVWTETRFSLLHDDAGAPCGIMGLTRDITARKEAEAALERSRDELERAVEERTAELLTINRSLEQEIAGHKQTQQTLAESEHRYRMLAEHAKDVIWTTDLDFNVTYVSPSCEQVLGYSPAELMAMPPRDFHNAEAYRDAVRITEEKVDLRGTPDYETVRNKGLIVVYRHRNGTEVIAEHRTSFLLDENGNPVGILGVSRDITDRRKAEEALRRAHEDLEERVLMRTRELSESEQRYRLLAENVKDVICLLDMNLDFTYVSPSVEKTLGFSPEEFMRLHLNEILVNTEDFKPFTVLAEALEHNRKGERSPLLDDICLEVRHHDGHTLWGEVVTSFLRDEDNNPVGILIVGRDVTARIHAEEENRRMQGQLLQAQKMDAIGRLAGGIAHDFNNMLTALMGYSELLLIKTDETCRPDVEKMRGICERASRLTSQLLAFSRRQMLERRFLDVNIVINDVQRMLTRLIAENVTITEDLSPEAWTVKADPANIEQIIMNLVINASDAMPEGGTITIATENVVITPDCPLREAVPGRFLRLQVRDTGHGIAPQALSEIFEPFYTTKEKGRGTGLGLAVVYGAIKQHDGWIHVESTPGEGSCFSIYLPARNENPGAPATVTASPQAAPTGTGERILLVEDEDEVRGFAARALNEAGYTVCEAPTAEAARQLMKDTPESFALVFSDVILPGDSGLVLCEELREGHPGLPVLLTSGYMDNQSQWPQIRKRGLPFLQKPYTVGDLLNAVNRSLAREIPD